MYGSVWPKNIEVQPHLLMRAIASHTKLEGKCRWVAILSEQRPREKTDTFLYWIQRGSLTVPPTQHLSNTNSTWGWVLSCTFRWVWVKFLGTQEGTPSYSDPTKLIQLIPKSSRKVSGSMDVNPSGWWSTEHFAITAIVFLLWIDAWFGLWDSKNGSNQGSNGSLGFCLPLITSKKERTFKGRWCWDFMAPTKPIISVTSQ